MGKARACNAKCLEKKCCRVTLLILPVLFAFWFVVSLLSLGFLAVKYITYLRPFQDLDLLYKIESASLSFPILLCLIAFVFIRQQLIGPLPLIIFIFLWSLVFTLLLVSILLDALFLLNFETNIKSGEYPLLSYFNAKEIPVFIKQYQIANSCCILNDDYNWKFKPPNPNNAIVESCCPTVTNCKSSSDWFPEPCMPLLTADYKGTVEKILNLALVGAFVLVVLLILYLLKAWKSCSCREDGSEDESDSEEDIPAKNDVPNRERIHLCMCVI